MIVVRRATAADRPAIFSFIQKAYQGRWQYKIPHRWNWAYIDNPFIVGNALPIWIAVRSSGEVVGQSCALIERIKIGNTEWPMGWGVDLVVDPQYRRQGLGFELKRANDEAHDVFMSLTMADRTQRINTRLGFVSLEPVPTYLRVSQLGPAEASLALINKVIPRGAIIKRGLAKLLRYATVDRAIAARLNLHRAQLDARLASSIDPSISITQVERFDAEVDSLWEEVSTSFHALIKRDQIYLNWKFAYQPHVQHVKLVARRQGKMRGYVVMRRGTAPEPNIGIIVDLLVSPSEEPVVMALLSQAVAWLVGQDVRSIIAATNITAYQACLVRFGFRPVTQDVPMIHFRKRDAQLAASLQPDRWLFSKGDQDWDQYPLATDSP